MVFWCMVALCAIAAVAPVSADQPVRWQQNEFAIGLWVDPPIDEKADARYKELAAAGFNTVIGGFGGDAARVLQLAAKHRMGAIVHRPKGEVKTWPKGKALIGYSLRDEPSAAEFPALRKLADEIRRERPGVLAYINLLPTYANSGMLGTPTYEEHVRRFVDEVNPDLLCFDHYPIFLPDGDGRDGYCANLEVFRRESLRAGVPYWNFFNSMPYGPHTDPTEAQLRWQVFASMAYGAKGVLYFCYYTPAGGEFPKGGAIIGRDDLPTRHYDHAVRLNRRIRSLGPYLVSAASTGVYRVKGDADESVAREIGVRSLKRGESVDPQLDLLVGGFQLADGRRAVLLMNYRYALSAWPTVGFDVPVESVLEVDQKTGKLAPVRDDSPDLPGLQVGLEDGEGRLFVLPAR